MVRLVGAAANEGRVEIYYDNEWGTVCDDAFGPGDGNVVCQQLGYTRLQRYTEGSNSTMGTGSIWLDDVNCTASHVRLSDCASRGWGVNDCDHSEDVTVICEGIYATHVLARGMLKTCVLHAHIDMHTHAHTHTYVCAHTHAYIPAHMHTHACTLKHTHAHTHTHTHTHTHAHTMVCS